MLNARLASRWKGPSIEPAGHRIPVLAYHFTGDSPDAEDAPYTLTPDLFEREMRFLAESGYRSVRLDHLFDAIAGRVPWPERGVVITFDDGRACVYHRAWPILRKYGLSATVFLLSSRLEHPSFLSREQIRAMEQRGVEFQSHGHAHRNFAGLTREEIALDVSTAKQRLDEMLAVEVSGFAYPYGGLNPVAPEVLAECGYRGAVCSRKGWVDQSSPVFEIPRLGMRGQDTVESFARKLGAAPPGSVWRRAGRHIAAALTRIRA